MWSEGQSCAHTNPSHYRIFVLCFSGGFDVYEGKNLPAGKKSYALSFYLQDTERTMSDKQIDAIMAKIRKSIEDTHGASLR